MGVRLRRGRAAELALELDRAGLDTDAWRVRQAVFDTPTLRKNGLRRLLFGYAHDGQRDLAHWALEAGDIDLDRGEALRILMSGPKPPPDGGLPARTRTAHPAAPLDPALGRGLAVAGDWDNLPTLLLRPPSPSRQQLR